MAEKLEKNIKPENKEVLETKESKKEAAPEKSDVEYETEELFSGMQVETEEDLSRAITNAFSEICGEYGKKEFFENALPAVKQIYGTNYRKAGLRLLEIIDKGAAHKPEEIGTYFKNAVSQEELEYSRKSKEEIIDDILAKISEIILEKRSEYGARHKGIVAAIIYGSFARKNFSLNSDLDIIYVSESQEGGEYIEEEDKYVHYDEEFEYSLGRKIRPPVENFYGTFYIGAEDKFRGLVGGKDHLISDAYIVVSPYPEIKAEIESLLKQEGKN